MHLRLAAFVVLLILLLFALDVFAKSPLREHQWENRLIILYLPDNEFARSTWSDLKSSIQKSQDKIKDRDLLLLRVGEFPRGKLSSDVGALSHEGQRTVQAELGLSGETPQLVLVGKDGSVKARQRYPHFDLEEFYALIDSMPMRQAEMRSRQG